MARESVGKKIFGGFIDLPQRQFIQILLFGALLGLFAFVVMLSVDKSISSSLICGKEVSCASATNIAHTIVQLLVGLVALLGLVRLSIYRPLLIIFGATVSLWGVTRIISTFSWYEGAAWSAIIFSLTYMLFSWLVRPRKFLPAAVLVVLAVVIARLVSGL